MDIKLPDGNIVRNVPEGTTRAEIKSKLVSAGKYTEDQISSWDEPTPEEEPTTEPATVDTEAPVEDPAPQTDPELSTEDEGQASPIDADKRIESAEGDAFRTWTRRNLGSAIPSDIPGVPGSERDRRQMGAPEAGPRSGSSIPSDIPEAPSEPIPQGGEQTRSGRMGDIVDSMQQAGRLVGSAGAGLLNETQRTFVGGTVVPITNTIMSVSNAARDVLGKGLTEEEKREQAENHAGAMNMIFSVGQLSPLSGEDREENMMVSVDERGNLSADRPETVVGNIAPYMLPVSQSFKFVQGMGALKKMSNSAKIATATVASGTAADQLITDPYMDNVFDVLEDTLPEDSESANLIGNYLATDEDSPEWERRMKMVGQDLLFTGAFSGVIGALSKGRNTIRPRNSEEAGEEFYKFVKHIKEDAKKVVKPKTRNGKPVYKDGRPQFEQVTDADGNPVFRTTQTEVMERVPTEQAMREISQIEAQSGGSLLSMPSLRRLTRQVLAPGGYWTKTLDKLSRSSNNEQRAIVKQADNIMNRLNQSVTRAARTAWAEQPGATTEDIRGSVDHILDNVNKALTEGRQTDFARLPESVREEVINARSLIDSLSAKMLDSPAVSDSFKKSVSNNMGTYLRRSYRAFVDDGYVPDEEVRERARNFMARSIQESDNTGATSWEQAVRVADDRVQGLLNEGGRKSYAEHLSDVHKINASTFFGRKDVPQEIRDLLGEITNPGDNIVMTANKLGQFASQDRFARELMDIGDGFFLHKAPTGKYNTPITGTNTLLDTTTERMSTTRAGQAASSLEDAPGFYTTPELAKALRGQQSMLVDPAAEGIMPEVLKKFTFLKGTSQASKTIYSHVTHAKNIIGAGMSRMANGSNPVTGASTAWQTVRNEVTNRGDVVYDELAEKYSRLGLTGTSVRAGEIKDLLDTALDNPNGLPEWLGDRTERTVRALGAGADTATAAGKKVRAGTKMPENVYIGTDDFFKIAEFEDYRATLGRSFPEASGEALDDMAANVVKRTMFNYDMVPPGIKRLRNLPVGNFVGFPAEVMRTSLNIVDVAKDEILSGNPELYARGLRRLTGYTAVAASGFEGVSHTTAELNGFNEEEKEALRRVNMTPWSQNPTPLTMRDPDTGELFTADANTLDAYEYFREPIKNLVNEVVEGRATNETFLETMQDGLYGSGKALVEPFVGLSLVNESINSIFSAALSEDGRSTDGTAIFTEGMTAGDKGGAIVSQLWEAWEPGFITSLKRLKTEFSEETQRYQDKPTNPGLEVLNNFTGLRFNKVDPEEFLTFSGRDYAGFKRDSMKITADNYTNPQDILDTYEQINSATYRQQRELFKDVQAAKNLGMDGVEVRSSLKESGLSDAEVDAAVNGWFLPYSISDESIQDINKRVFADESRHDMTKEEFRHQIIRLRNDLAHRDLEEFEVREDNEAISRGNEAIRERFFQGGFVDVPKTAVNPKTRVDKETGMPYNQQAGEAFDNMSVIEKVLQGGLFKREQFQFGGAVNTKPSYTQQEQKQRFQTPTPPKAREIAAQAPVQNMFSGFQREHERRIKLEEGGFISKVGSALQKAGEGLNKAVKSAEGFVSEKAGISDEDVDWAHSVGEQYPSEEALDGRGDAARHMALGWIADQSDSPRIAKALVQARELTDFQGQGMDWANNAAGFNLEAADRGQAEQMIHQTIESGDAEFMTPEESRERRNYKRGGLVSACKTAKAITSLG